MSLIITDQVKDSIVKQWIKNLTKEEWELIGSQRGWKAPYVVTVTANNTTALQDWSEAPYITQ